MARHRKEKHAWYLWLAGDPTVVGTWGKRPKLHKATCDECSQERVTFGESDYDFGNYAEIAFGKMEPNKLYRATITVEEA